MNANITVIGNSVIDVLAGPVNENILKNSSTPVDGIKTSFGGDALNESVVLSKLGKNVEIITKTGKDGAGSRILKKLEESGVCTEKVITDSDVETSVNIVLVEENGERHFITNPRGSQRRLNSNDIISKIDTLGEIVSFASIFVSSSIGLEEMTDIFRLIKNKGSLLVADMTKAKNGEKIKDLKPLLQYVDYLFPNEEEIELLTGLASADENALLLMEMGVKHPVIKCGAKGCVIGVAKEKIIKVPAYSLVNCIDTTGAGDCFVAGFIWALSEGYDIEECGKFANATASVCVEKLGATEGIENIENIKNRYNNT